MSPRNLPILNRALELPPIERVELIEKLLSSFEFRSRKKIDALWAREVEDRLDAFEEGKIKSIPARKVFAKIDKSKELWSGLSNTRMLGKLFPDALAVAVQADSHMEWYIKSEHPSS